MLASTQSSNSLLAKASPSKSSVTIEEILSGLIGNSNKISTTGTRSESANNRQNTERSQINPPAEFQFVGVE